MARQPKKGTPDYTAWIAQLRRKRVSAKRKAAAAKVSPEKRREIAQKGGQASSLRRQFIEKAGDEGEAWDLYRLAVTTKKKAIRREALQDLFRDMPDDEWDWLRGLLGSPAE